eukprot:CCRYP_005984-RA/>CCRYP_005984-RA protein AED:0.24 eAED:-0.41 QI:0/-1/0/1/-1/1/1/0/1017
MIRFGMNAASIETVEAISTAEEDVSKVRITLRSSLETRRFVDRWKRRGLCPMDILCHDDGGGGCCGECGARYGGRPIQITHVSPVAVPEDGLTNEEEDSIRWGRAAPPKFQRIINGDVEDMEQRRSVARFVYLENVSGWGVAIESTDTTTHVDEMRQCILSILNGDALPLEKLMNEKCNNNSNAYDDVNKFGSNGLVASDVQDDIHQAFQEGFRHSISLCPSLASTSLGVELFMKTDTKQKKNKTKNGLTDGSNHLYNHFHVGMRSHEDAARLIQDWQGKQLELTIDLPTSFVSLFRDKDNYIAHEDATLLDLSTSTRAIITMNKLFLDYADISLPKRVRTRLSPEAQTPGLPSRSECTSTTSHIYIPGLHLLPNYVSSDEEQVLLAVLTGPEAPWAPPQYTPSGGQIKRRVQHYGYVFDYESADVLRRDVNTNVGVDNTGIDASCCPPLPAVNWKSLDKAKEVDDLEEWIAQHVAERRGWEVLAGVIERTRRMAFSSYFEIYELKKRDGLNFDEQTAALSLNNEDSSMVEPRSHNHNHTISVQEGNEYQIESMVEPDQGTDESLKCGSSTKGTYSHINQLTVNEYAPGQGIGSHVDTESAFDDGLLIITLNGGIVMEFRKVGEDTKKLVYLPPRSLILLSGDARYRWEHMIVSRTTDTVEGEVIPRTLRVSLTLRTALTVPLEGEQAVPLSRFESTIFPPYWGQPSDTQPVVDVNTSAIIERTDLITPVTESKHVHAVYDAIATQWHHTRGKRGVLWPGATQFLENLPPGSIVADVGCGDGKYFSAILGANSYVIGTDISEALLRTASSTEKSDGNKAKAVNGPQYQRLSDEKLALSAFPAVAVADCIHLPIRSGSCDAAICIAVMHHLSTVGRRIRCLTELARVVKVGGLINVQAWALEQEGDSKRKFNGSDLLVPFNAQPKYLQASLAKTDDGASNYDSAADGKGVAQMISESYDGAEFDSKKNLVIFQRYCHLYRRGELEELVAQIPCLELIESAYEKGNHVVLLRVCGADMS